jgi:hypothetical protein
MHRVQAKGCEGAGVILFEEDDQGTMTAEHADMWQTLLRLVASADSRRDHGSQSIPRGAARRRLLGSASQSGRARCS